MRKCRRSSGPDRLAGLFREPGDRAVGIDFHHSPGRRTGRVEHRQGRDPAVFGVFAGQQPQIEVGQVVRVARQDQFFTVHPLAVRGERADCRAGPARRPSGPKAASPARPDGGTPPRAGDGD